MVEAKKSKSAVRKTVHKPMREVAKPKKKVYDELYEGLDTREGEKELHHLVKRRDPAGKAGKVWVIKDRDGNAPTREKSELIRWR